MRYIALTGNIGSGKSTVARLLGYLGISVFDADVAGHEVLTKGDVLKEIGQEFGEPVTDKNGKVDRKALAGIVFNDENKLRRLSAIVHPRVMQAFKGWAESLDSVEIAVLESAIIYEYDLAADFDEVIVVVAPETVRTERIILRDGASADDVRQRIARQWSEDRKVSLADHIIVNDGRELLLPQVLKILEYWGVKPRLRS